MNELGLLMAYKLLEMAQARWRRLDGAHLLPLDRRATAGGAPPRSSGASPLGGGEGETRARATRRANPEASEL